MHFPSLLILLATSPAVLAWGELGHRTVAKIAYTLLQADTQRYIDDILSYKDGRDISDAAIWPDQIRHFRPETSGWHYIDARDDPPHTCHIDYPSDCAAQPGGACIIGAIRNQTALFSDPTVAQLVRQEALKFVIHFIGDLHQPLHTENLLRGGNDIHVCWHRACARESLHAVWDTAIPMAAAGVVGHPKQGALRGYAERWAADLLQQQVNTGGGWGGLVDRERCPDIVRADECTLRWATQANKLNCEYVFKSGREALEGKDLSGDYYKGAKPLVEDIVTKAGIRLAGWIEAMVKSVKERENALVQRPEGEHTQGIQLVEEEALLI